MKIAIIDPAPTGKCSRQGFKSFEVSLMGSLVSLQACRSLGRQVGDHASAKRPVNLNRQHLLRSISGSDSVNILQRYLDGLGEHVLWYKHRSPMQIALLHIGCKPCAAEAWSPTCLHHELVGRPEITPWQKDWLT